MSKEAITYLREYKDIYAKSILIESLRKAGYVEEDIEKSLNEVYNHKGSVNIEQTKKIKKNKYTPWQKTKDILLGIFFIIIFNIFAWIFSFFIIGELNFFKFREYNFFLQKVLAITLYMGLYYLLIKHYFHKRLFCAYTLIFGAISMFFSLLSQLVNYYF